MNVAEYLLGGKKQSSAALLTLDGSYTYADLSRAAIAIASFLVRHGGHKGDRVLLLGENSFSWVAVYLGVLRAGMVAVPLPVRTAPDDLEYIAATVEPLFAFLEAHSAARLADRLRSVTILCDRPASAIPHAVSIEEIQRQERSSATTPAEVEANDLAALMFTSGSTGKPRGVMVSARNVIANTNSIIEYLSLASTDRIMTVLPFHYCFGTSLLHTHLRVGGSIVLDHRFLYPDEVLLHMSETNCTGFAGVPSHFQILLHRSGLAHMHLPSLRYMQQAGGHLPPGIVRELRRAVPNTEIFLMYGMTEAAPRLSYLPPPLIDSKPGSIGKGIPGVTLQVLDESGQPVGPGQIGRIVAKGDNIALGYWQDPDATAKTFRDGKLYTCDLATVDEDGFIYIVDRDQDFIKCGGQRVSSRSIEDMLLESGIVLEAAVIRIPDAVLGEAAKAFVVPRNRSAQNVAEHLMRFCHSKVPPPLVPKEIVVVNSLPKNSSGKVLKKLLEGYELMRPSSTVSRVIKPSTLP